MPARFMRVIRHKAYSLQYELGLMNPYSCHVCKSEMPVGRWKCYACNTRNRIYSRGQWVAAVALAFLIVFFMAKR